MDVAGGVAAGVVVREVVSVAGCVAVRIQKDEEFRESIRLDSKRRIPTLSFQLCVRGGGP